MMIEIEQRAHEGKTKNENPFRYHTMLSGLQYETDHVEEFHVVWQPENPALPLVA